jgi:hypothetical protein
MVVPLAVMAAELNPGSSDPHFTVDQSHQGTVNLTVNGESKQVGAGASLTAAEYAAFINVMNGHEQTLNIGAGGVATGGTLKFIQVISPVRCFLMAVLPSTLQL